MESGIFIIPKPVKNPRLRLFCFPYAGGSAATYLPWVRYFGDGIELVAVQPPGQASRMLEAPHENMEAYIREVIAHARFITSTPYIFIGHSLGSRGSL